MAGIPLDDVVDPQHTKADYSCLDGQMVVEIKTLEDDASERVANITDELQKRPDWPIFFGAVPLEACLDNLEGETERIRLDIINRIGRSTIRHLRKANKQLGAHCAKFPRPDTVRVVILINEDHADYDPQTVVYILQHELKRWSQGGPELGNIDSVVYLSERHATVEQELLILPIVSVEGYGSKEAPWKEAIVSRLVEAWAAWNGSRVLPLDGHGPEFEAVDILPEVETISDHWRNEYRRNPSLRPLSFEQLRDAFDEVVVMSLLFGHKDSPRKITPEQAMPIFRRFGDITDELKHRRIPMQKVQQDSERLTIAAQRLGLEADVVRWIEEVGDPTQ